MKAFNVEVGDKIMFTCASRNIYRMRVEELNNVRISGNGRRKIRGVGPYTIMQFFNVNEDNIISIRKITSKI